jgi:hypothetical protein
MASAHETNTPESKKASPEALREAFSQACQMYRHFVSMRYYNFAVFGVVTAGLATLYFQQIPQDARLIGWWVKGCGIVVAALCGMFEWRLTDVMYYYQERIEALAMPLDLSDFKNPPGWQKWRIWLRAISVVLFGAAIIAWLWIADR